MYGAVTIAPTAPITTAPTPIRPGVAGLIALSMVLLAMWWEEPEWRDSGPNPLKSGKAARRALDSFRRKGFPAHEHDTREMDRAVKALGTFRKKGFPAPHGRRVRRKRERRKVDTAAARRAIRNRYNARVKATNPEQYRKRARLQGEKSARYRKAVKENPQAYAAHKSKANAARRRRRAVNRTMRGFRAAGFPRHE